MVIPLEAGLQIFPISVTAIDILTNTNEMESISDSFWMNTPLDTFSCNPKTPP